MTARDEYGYEGTLAPHFTTNKTAVFNEMKEIAKLRGRIDTLEKGLEDTNKNLLLLRQFVLDWHSDSIRINF